MDFSTNNLSYIFLSADKATKKIQNNLISCFHWYLLIFMLKPDLPYFDDPEGETLPSGCTRVIDTHIHIFPGTIFNSIWQWFDKNAWKIRYQMKSAEIFTFLFNKGISHLVALQYAHKPGIARSLNQYMSEQIKAFPGKISGMATIYPGEPEVEDILKMAFKNGLSGVKLHAHVQCFDMNADYMDIIYQTCSDEDKPMIMHVGTEPKSDKYTCDPYQICSAEKLEQVISNFPRLKVCVPHLGFGEIEAFKKLIETYDNLWTDTTMVICDYFPLTQKVDLSKYRIDRVMYGSDFPNIPYEWDRELKVLMDTSLSDQDRSRILHKNASAFLNLENRP